MRVLLRRATGRVWYEGWASHLLPQGFDSPTLHHFRACGAIGGQKDRQNLSLLSMWVRTAPTHIHYRSQLDVVKLFFQ